MPELDFIQNQMWPILFFAAFFLFLCSFFLNLDHWKNRNEDDKEKATIFSTLSWIFAVPAGAMIFLSLFSLLINFVRTFIT